MGRARDQPAEPNGASEDATLAAVDAWLAAHRSERTPLSRALDAVFDARPDRRPTRVVLELAARSPARPRPRSVVAAATAVDLLHARTLVRWRGLPARAPDSTAAVLVGDYLHSLAFEALVEPDDGVSASLLDAVTAGVTDLYAAEAADADDDCVPRAATRRVFALADAAVDALAGDPI